MLSKSHLVGSSVLSVIFVALLYWYSSDFITRLLGAETENAWPENGVDRETLDWIEEYWQIDSFPSATENDVFRFWYLSSFEGSYILKLELSSSASGAVSLAVISTDEMSKNNVPWLRSYDGALSKAEIFEFRAVLDSVHFWNSPPGNLGWICTDLEVFVVETNIDGSYKLWANSCEASPEMKPIAKYASRVAQRVSGSAVREIRSVQDGN